MDFKSLLDFEALNVSKKDGFYAGSRTGLIIGVLSGILTGILFAINWHSIDYGGATNAGIGFLNHLLIVTAIIAFFGIVLFRTILDGFWGIVFSSVYKSIPVKTLWKKYLVFGTILFAIWFLVASGAFSFQSAVTGDETTPVIKIVFAIVSLPISTILFTYFLKKKAR